MGMDFLPISVCYAAMLMKVIQCWNDGRDIQKHEILSPNGSGTQPRKWRGGQATGENMHRNFTRGNIKKQEVSSTNSMNLVRVHNTTAFNITESPALGSSNDSSRDLQTQQTSSTTQVVRPFFHRINATLTRSKDAVWATISLTFICILLLLAVAHSQMWKGYRGSETQHGIPRPNFNERVPLKEVLEHRMKFLREFIQKKKNKNRSPMVELESLLHDVEN